MDTWTADRVQYIKGLKAPNQNQQLLVALYETQSRSSDDERKLKLLVKAERATDKAEKAKADVVRALQADKMAARKARDHELYQVAGLLSLAGLVDKTTGKALWDEAELLGALSRLKTVAANHPKRAEWKAAGLLLLNGQPQAAPPSPVPPVGIGEPQGRQNQHGNFNYSSLADAERLVG